MPNNKKVNRLATSLGKWDKKLGTKPYKKEIFKVNLKTRNNDSLLQEVYHGKFTMAEVRAIATKTNQTMGPGKSLQVVYKANDGRWKSGLTTKHGEDVIMYEDIYDGDVNEGEEIDDFMIWIKKDGPKAGGCESEMNDCLYYCLEEALPMKLPFKNPADLKKKLKLNRKDKVPITMIEEVERRLKHYKITVSGDHTFSSTKNSNAEIRLLLREGHYTLEERPNHKLHKQVAFTERKLIIVHYKVGNIQGYDGKEYFKIDDKEYMNAKSKIYKSNYIMVKCFIKRKDGKPITDINEQMKLSYETFMHDAPIMKEQTEGFINILKTGDEQVTALDMFHKLSVPFHPDPISQDESNWLEEASMGAIMFAQQYAGPAWKSDICSQYPSIMKNVRNRFPIKRGKFRKLDTLETQVKVGIYKCKISPTNIFGETNRFFRYNKFNKYTNIDIILARQMCLDVELINESPNALIYEYEDCIAGSQLFGTYVDMLFDLKQNYDCKYAKNILNVLWGKLCERKTKSKTFDMSQESAELDSKYEVLSIRPKDDKLLVEYYDETDIYESRYARIKPFIPAMGRRLLYQYAEKVGLENIVRVHTDGMISREKPNIKYGTSMGELKNEGYCDYCIVYNVKNVKGEFRDWGV